jgi:hypothetical protein
MSPFDHSEFYDALHDLVRDVARVPVNDFEQRWQRARAKADQRWVRETSAFNVDTWLLQCVCEEFAELELYSRPEIHDIFFRFQKSPGFGKHLIGSEFDFRFPDGVTERVKILEVFLGPRYGMGYRIESATGRRMEFEKFD